MSFYVLATGTIVADPQRREGAKGPFAIGSIRTLSSAAEESDFVSFIGFHEQVDRLLELRRGSAISISGRARLRTYADKNGIERTNLSVVVEQLIALKPRHGRDGNEGQGRSQDARGRPSGQSPYSAPRAPGRVPDLPSDVADDLYPGPIP
jgi:single-stranded DNA-binding protein